jgi:hypothetical protein
VRWFRPRPQRLVLQTVQMRVAIVDPELGDGPAEPAAPLPELEPLESPQDAEALETPEAPAASPARTTLVAEVSAATAAPPLAVRPVEDAEWTFRN